MANKYRKKPVVIEAIQWNGRNESDIWTFIGMFLQVSRPPHNFDHHNDITDEMITMTIPTLEGDMKAIRTDWIVKGIKGEIYPVKNDIFEMTYEPVNT